MPVGMVTARVTRMTAVVARTVVVTEAETHHRRRRAHHARRGGRHVDHARSALHVDDLRRGLHHLCRRLLVNRRRVLHHRRVLHDRRPGGGVDLLAIARRSLINHRRRRVISGLLRRERSADQGTRHTTDDGTLGPTIAVVPADETTRDRTDHRAISDRGPEDLRVDGTNPGNRKRDRDKESFHFVAVTRTPRRLFTRVLAPAKKIP